MYIDNIQGEQKSFKDKTFDALFQIVDIFMGHAIIQVLETLLSLNKTTNDIENQDFYSLDQYLARKKEVERII